MAGLYNNNINPIPGNGADVFGDKLVGNQFVDGVSQFTLGNFSVSSNFTQKDSRNFSLGNFSEPINLETLQITDINESRILASNKLEVFIRFDRSKVTNYTLYGSLRERLKVAVQQVINKFPASMSFNQFRTWDDYMSGETATNVTFNPNTNETTLSLNLYTLFNPFGIEFTQSSLVSTGEEINIIRNLLFSFKKYSLYKNNVQYPLTFIEATSGNTNIGNLNIQVQGNPFSGNSSTTDTFLIKPNTLTTEESFDSMEDIERFLVERNQNPIYTAKFQQPLEADNGVVIKGTTSVTWPSTSDNNLIIEGDLFNSYLDKLYDVAGGFDKYKTNLISRFLTTAAFKEFDTYDEKVDKILKIYGRSFDDVKKYIDGLAYMTNVTYDSQNNIPNELLKNLAQTLGWGTPSAIKNEGFLDTIFKRNENPEYPSQGVSETPSELDFELYRRLLVNTAYLFKSKGTRRGIEFMLRFVGAPEALIEFNEHVYVAGQPMNMEKFKDFELKISGGTYTEEKPVLQTYFSAATNTFPPVVVTGFSQGYETVTRTTSINPQDLPVDIQGYPTVPRYGPNAYFQAGAGWFEETTEHRGKEVLDLKTSIFTGNTPFIKTKLNQFTYGEPYLELYRKFPDSKLGFPIVRTVDNKKSWVKKDSEDFRYLNLPDRGTNYQTKNDKLVVNVKNVDVFLNVGQGLEWDVWNFSKRYSCPFGPNVLSSPYPGVGGPDWTEILADATKLSFFEFAQKFWTVLINVKNRQTIDDGHAGGYPTLLSTYLDYMNSSQTCGIPSNQYTYEKMIAYVENMGDYWIRLLEQLIPATTIWQGGVKYENSIFHRYKYSYKHEPLCDDIDCFGSFVNCCYPISNDILVGAVNECGELGFSGATWQNNITLGGTNYTGNIYYSSTTITDIPSTDTWLNDMVGILSGITADVSDPNHTLTYYLINDNNTPTSIPIDQPNCIVIQGPCGTGEEICYTSTTIVEIYDPCVSLSCSPGFTLVGDNCVSTTASTVVSGETIIAASKASAYGGYGARFCVPNTYATCGAGALASDFLQITGIPFWGTLLSTDGRLNEVGVWLTEPPVIENEWIGFSTCITATTEGQYLIALAGDNGLRFSVDGVLLVENPWDGSLGAVENFRNWWVWPLDLSAGEHVINLEGYDVSGVESFGCEIIGPYSAGTFTDNTDFNFFSGQTGIDSYTANTFFKSSDEIGGTFNTQTNLCPSGYTYDVCSDSCIQFQESACVSGYTTATTATTVCVTYPEGEDLWNFNNGSQPNCFKSDICLTLNTCEICIPICYSDEHGDNDIPLYSPLETYNYGDTVLFLGDIYIWEGGPSGGPTPRPTDTSSKNYWRKLPAIECIPFLGGNNFMEGVDCDNFDEVIEPPEITGTTVTTQPEIFKDGIFNVGGQDCFESTYNPCEELVDACACMATYPDFPTNTLFTLGQVVCCPGNGDVAPTKWIRVNGFYDLISGTFTPSDTACKEVEIFFSPLCQYPQPASVKCWAPCDNENSAAGISSGGIWGKETINRRDNLPPIIVNDRSDPCDPQEPTEPTNICLECDETPSKNIDLEFYDIPLTQVPQRVMNFTLSQDELQENFSISPNSALSQFESGFFKFKKARINLCCLGDKFTNYFRVYHRTGPVPEQQGDQQQISYGHVEQNFDVNQNTIVEFYYLQRGPIDQYSNQTGDGFDSGSSLNGGGKPLPQFNRNNPLDGLYMFIPQSTNSLQSPPLIVDNPILGQNTLNSNPTFSSFFSGIVEFCAQIGRKNPGGSVGQYRLNKITNDSLYLTDNGTGTNDLETTDFIDRYWALDPSFNNGDGIYGALDTPYFERMVGSILGSNSNLKLLRLRYNWEMQLSCNGREVNLLTFTPLMSPETTVYTNGDVPLSPDCGTDMRAPIVNQNVSSSKLTVNLAEKVSRGNVIDVPIDKTMIEIGDVGETLKNYNVSRSEIYIISNTNPLRNNRSIEYNSPVTITNTNGPTSETFVENNRKRIKLGWLDKISQGSSNNNLNIEFISTENQARFAQDIRKKSVGNGVLTIPTEGLVSLQENNDENVTFYNPNNNRSVDIRVNVDGENTNRNYVTYTDLRDWALNTIGEIKNFSNKEVIYGEAGLVKRFHIGPTYTSNVANSQYHIGLVPIGDVETEFLISTLGSFEDYVKNQTGSTSSGLTITLTGLSTNYSGYTNLSGYTDNQEQNISPDFVFDISLKGSNMSLNSNVAMSDPIQGEFRLLGDDRQLQPSIPLQLVDREPVLFNLTRQDVSMGGEYFHYKVPKTQNYRLQYRSHLKLEYIDEGWCDYLNVYRNITQNTFPSNDYEFKQLINSSILYEGGFPSAPVEYQEGNVVNPYTQSYGSLVPVFGYNPNKGLGNFSTTVFIERVTSGTTSATTLGSYTVSSNSTTYPNTDETLILPYNNSDKFTDLYQCTGSTGTTVVFTKKCDIYIDTGSILLNEGDEIRLKVNVDWQSTTKAFTGSTTGTTVNLTLGSNYDSVPQSRPWFRVINKECNLGTSTNYLYWQPNEDSILTESFMDGKNVPPAPDDRKGKLTLLNSIGQETNYLVPKVRRDNLNELTYLDIPKVEDYRGPLNLIPTDSKTNRWVKAIEEGRITDYRINDTKMLNKVGDTKVQWSLPINVNDSIESISLDDSSNSFIVQSTVNVKGTGNSFDIINTLQPNVTMESIKEPKNESQDLMSRGTISYISSRPLEDRTIDFRENHTIIRDKVVIIESGVYDKDTPTPTPSRREFCKCSRNEYLEVPKDSNSPCSKWCCANNYKGTEYYGCKGKTPNQWKEGLSRETIVSSKPLIITEGKPPGVIRF